MVAVYASTQNPMDIPALHFKAGGTILKGRLLKLDTTEGQAIHTTAITDLVIGVALHGASANDPIAVQVYGVAQVAISAAVTLGDQMMPGASGLGATAAGATAKSCGVILQDGAATPDQVRVLLACPNVNGIVNT